MVEATHGHYLFRDVTGPLGSAVLARWGMLGDGKTAIIEMASASGLHHVPTERRNPMLTTSYGTGELILAALDHGVEHIILGIGGSATNDGGAGMLQALGVALLDESGEPLPSGGGALRKLAKIDTTDCDQRLRQVVVTVACDVNNPLCGPKGASAIFGPQKGATEEMVAVLDSALAVFGQHLQEITGREVMNIAGAGAAGGMGAALLGVLNAELKPGVEIVIDALHLESQVADASLVITGEGRLDSQSISGKTPIGVARCAKQYQKPVIALAGGLTKDHQIVHEHGLDAVFSVLTRIATLPEALQDAEYNLRVSARNVASVWKLSQQHTL
jgi:glycerate kinase